MLTCAPFTYVLCLGSPWPQVVKRLPNLKKLDGMPVDVDEREQANVARGG